ncbi:cation-translocating P-type ATPase [Vibrio japonicus]|uniref:Cation-transporting P-type ATPase n=1 Tax=Vibrio japonicus TaxID=1824638 RepID=A0ABY5LNQ2_9VIBR|nr:cation-transporting P-type ATPase [Vibrio japonicus]UUM32785.1 cation-transporting P-type ATPase [Vibrio japonicus]
MTESSHPWHSQSVEDTFSALSSQPNGLEPQEASQRLAQYGLNKLPTSHGRTVFQRFIAQFHNVLIHVLLVVMVITALLNHWVDAGVIAGVVVINAIIGFLQEGKAETALNAIQAMLAPTALVLRGGHQVNLKAEELVVGDVVILQSGDRVPADLRLFRSKGLQVAEAVLTGESLATEKNINPVSQKSALADRDCMAYSGTMITHGQGSGVVVATGLNTELGKISSLVSRVKPATTPLLKQIAQFSQWLTVAILVVAVATFAFGLLVRGYPITDMFLAAISLAVAAIPEGLPAIMTITLAIGVERMAKRNAIIRRLPAVETLGSVTVICTDKTGTLTRNEMTVTKIVTANEQFELSGTGYDPHGVVTINQQAIYPEQKPLLIHTVRAAVLCNDATLQHQNEQWQIQGDPMEGALLVAGEKAGLDSKTEHQLCPRTDLIPFESEHRFMATLHHNHKGEAFVFLKGAPERVLDICSHQMINPATHNETSLHLQTTALDRTYWQKQIDAMAKRGMRVLAMAYRPAEYEHIELTFDDVRDNLILLGLFGFIDPPRDEAIQAVKACNQAGIRVKMMTGDHVLTAKAIAQQIGLINTQDSLTGLQIDALNDEELFAVARDIDIYARVSPEHKMRLVDTLQKHHQVVAMTGDGVNDAPALKRSDIGTAMGLNGTASAKEAAEMVLTDDNFASITAAVEEGRAVYDNLKKAILFILPTNGGEALVILSTVVLGFKDLPLTPIQILWVNMITAVTLALSLAFEPKEHNLMQRAPRSPDTPILTSHLIWRVCFVSIILMLGTLGMFVWEMAQQEDIDRARTIAVNTLVMFEVFYLFNSRFILNSIFCRRGLTGNVYVLIAIAVLMVFQAGFTYLPIMQTLFGTQALEFEVWLRIVLVASSALFLVELEKYYLRRTARIRC